MRQAVIIIHGVGEQRPMDTLRTFIHHIAGGVIRNKPDKMSSLFELRRLQVPSNRNQPLTDFYEYYWAHHMRDSSIRTVLSWFRSLLFKNPKNVSKSLRVHYVIFWLLFLMASYHIVEAIRNAIAGSYGKAISLSFMAVIMLIFDYIFLRITYGTIDDAARYLNPHPDNISQRNKIREEGIKLLETLHESKKYSRIIIVGHSLGSVIAYDLIRLYWSSLQPHSDSSSQKQASLKTFKKEVNEIFSNNDLSIDSKVSKYQELQLQLWRELRVCGWPWLITDFITVGSPLAHADMLLAQNRQEFHTRQQEGEYPVCPPMDEHELYYKVNFLAAGAPRSLYRPTHLAPFMCTQWSNVYFPHKNLVQGDLIGGPLQHVFGYGIRDIPVGLKGLRGSLLSHTKYWKYESDKHGVDSVKHPTRVLRALLKLDCLRGKMSWPNP